MRAFPQALVCRARTTVGLTPAGGSGPGGFYTGLKGRTMNDYPGFLRKEADFVEPEWSSAAETLRAVADEMERLHDSIKVEKKWRKDSDERAEQLQAIVDKFPKTADEVHVVPGMKVYWIGDSGGGESVAELQRWDGYQWSSEFADTFTSLAEIRKALRAREAAEAAKTTTITRKTNS